jgi:filamentous hemagglutinin family protein
MSKKNERQGLRPTLIAASVAACFSLSAQQATANPTGLASSVNMTSMSGYGTGALTINTTGNSIFNWQGFSIGVNEITRILQASGASSASLHRVLAGGDISTILGTLQSNGRVFLINPAGVVFGAGARIDVAGLVASSLAMSDNDFLAGRMRFTEVPGAGPVVNRAGSEITAATGGRVYLVAPSVENSGIIRAPQGEILLAAGKSAELVSESSPYVTVRVTADAEQALNVGSLIAESGRIGMYGALVRNSGMAEASGAVTGPGGSIRFVATKDLTLDAGSRTIANGASGGDILLQAQGGTNLISGSVEAKGASGNGGNIQALGVRVGVVGHGILDASGDTGGGTVLVGGDFQGKNAGVQNAEQTLIGSDGIIRADAGTTGDGGRVIVWSDQYTRFYGSISARGGSQSGNGGFVETSGHVLDALGKVATGKGGNWLIDPFDLDIVDSGTTVSPTLPNVILFTNAPTSGTSTLGMDVINNALTSYGTVTAQAQHDINFATSGTNVIFNAGTVTAQAGNNINLGSHNLIGNGTNFVATANDTSAGYGSGVGSITSNSGFGNVSTGGGFFTASGYNITVGSIDTTGTSSANTSVNVTASNMAITGPIMTGNATGVNASANANVFVSGTNGIIINGGVTTGSSTATGGSPYGGNSAISLQSTGAAGSVIVHGPLSAGMVTSSGGSGFSEIFLYGSSVSVEGNMTTLGATSAGGFVATDVGFSGPCCSSSRIVSVGGSIVTGSAIGGSGNSSVNVYGSATGGTFSVGGGITTGNAPNSSFVNIQSGDVKVGSIATGVAGTGSSFVTISANVGNVVTGSVATGTALAPYGSSAVNLLAPYGSIQAGSISTGSAYGSSVLASAKGDVATGGITTRSSDPAYAGGAVALSSSTGSVKVNGKIDTRGAAGTASHPNASAGGNVLITAPVSVAVGQTATAGITRTVIDTSGGAGALVGTGGAAGNVTIDPTAILLNGNVFAIGGAGNGAAGGAGGHMLLQTTNGVGTITFINGGYDVTGGSGSPPGASGIATAGGTLIFVTLLTDVFSNPEVAQSIGSTIGQVLSTTTSDDKHGDDTGDSKNKKGGFSSCKA